MFGAVIHAPGDVRYEERPDPTIEQPTDAVIRTVAACVCGSDLWRYRGISEVKEPTPIGHEYVGVVEEVGPDVATVAPGDFVVGGFTPSCGVCAACRKGATCNCLDSDGYRGCQADRIRVPHADGTLLVVPGPVPDDLIPSLLALSDVMCTGWHGAVSARVAAGTSVVVVGDGAVGLCAVLSAATMGAEKVIALSRHADRQAVAREFGATHIIAERGEGAITAIQELTDGIGADCVIECVGTEDARLTAVNACRVGGDIGLLGVPHGDLPVDQLFWQNKGLKGGPAHVRAYLPHLLDLVLSRQINPGRVFDLELPLADIAEAYAAMDERRAIKSLVRP